MNFEKARHIDGERNFNATENMKTDGTTVLTPSDSDDSTDSAVLCGKASAQNERYAEQIIESALLSCTFVIIFITSVIKLILTFF